MCIIKDESANATFLTSKIALLFHEFTNIKGGKQPRNIPQLFSTIKDSDHQQTNFYNKNEETYCVSERTKL